MIAEPQTKALIKRKRWPGWLKLVAFLWMGFFGCVAIFSRTENMVLRSCLLVLVVSVIILQLTENLGWSFDRHPRVTNFLGIVYIVSGVLFLSLGVHPPNIWLFGIFGLLLVLSGIFWFTLASSDVTAPKSEWKIEGS